MRGKVVAGQTINKSLVKTPVRFTVATRNTETRQHSFLTYLRLFSFN